MRFPRLPVPGFTALLTGLGLAAAELGGELPLVITVADEEVSRVPVRAVNEPSQCFHSFLLVESVKMYAKVIYSWVRPA